MNTTKINQGLEIDTNILDISNCRLTHLRFCLFCGYVLLFLDGNAGEECY